MDLCPTDSNLTERETASDSEVNVDPVGEVKVSGPSSAASSTIQSPPSSGPSAGQEGNPRDEDRGHRSSPTLPQAAAIPRSGRRRRALATAGYRRQVDNGLLEYLSRTLNDDSEELYLRSLAPYLNAIPRAVRLRARGAIQIIIDACTPPNNPTPVFSYLERWQMSSDNQFQRPRIQPVPLPTWMPSPPPHQDPYQHQP